MFLQVVNGYSTHLFVSRVLLVLELVWPLRAPQRLQKFSLLTTFTLPLIRCVYSVDPVTFVSNLWFSGGERGIQVSLSFRRLLPLWSVDCEGSLWCSGSWRSLPLPKCRVILCSCAWNQSMSYRSMLVFVYTAPRDSFDREDNNSCSYVSVIWGKWMD